MFDFDTWFWHSPHLEVKWKWMKQWSIFRDIKPHLTWVKKCWEWNKFMLKHLILTTLHHCCGLTSLRNELYSISKNLDPNNHSQKIISEALSSNFTSRSSCRNSLPKNDDCANFLMVKNSKLTSVCIGDTVKPLWTSQLSKKPN